MNERIRELAEQAWDATAVGPEVVVLVLFAEKFAELIVLETINCAAHIEGIEAIKQHFGIDNN